MALKPEPRPRTKTDEKTLRGRPVWIDETGEITGKKGAKYSEVTTTIPFGTQFITAPTIDENGNRLSDDEVKQKLKDNQGRDFITGEKLPVFSSKEKASEYAEWRSSTMFDEKAIKEGFPEETFPDLPEDKREVKEKESLLEKGKDFLDYLTSPSRHGVFKEAQYNKGGALMEEQMQMAFMSEGGLKDDGMDKDPVSGNEVPSGSMAEEVRDDIPAQLSEGEYVVPADVVRYYGVKFFEDLRDQAKMGLAEMEANGRIGGEPVPAGGPVNDEELSPEEMQAIREVMGMAEGGDIQNPYMQQQLLYSQPRPAPIDDQEDTLLDITNPVVNQMPIQNMAVGGQIQGYQTGGLEQSFLNAGQSAVNRGFVGFPLGATIFPSERTGQTVLGPTGTQVVTTDAIDTAATAFTTVTLYGPNGEVVVLTLPTDIDRYNELIALGYTTIMPGVTTTTTTDSDDAVTTDDDDITTITTGTKRKRKIDKPDIDPNSWMKKFDYTGDLATNNLAQQTSDELKKAPVGGVIGAFINGQNAAQAAANIIILENNGGDPTKIAELKAEHQKFIKDTNLSYLPDQLINGDALAKDIVKNNIDIALNRDSKDINNKPIFKDDNDFNNFMQEVAPEGMTFDPSITSATTNNAGETVTVQGGYTRKGSATPTVSPRPSSIVKPTPPTEPISTPTASDLAAAKAVDDALAAKALEDKIERDRAAAKEAARIAARDRRKKKSRIEKENLAARSINPYDIDPAAINKGGLMAKGKKKK